MIFALDKRNGRVIWTEKGWLKQVVVRLPTEIANSGDVKVTLKSHDTAGNTVMLKVMP